MKLCGLGPLVLFLGIFVSLLPGGFNLLYYLEKTGICGQAPSDFPEFAEFLVECGIDSISLVPDTVTKTRLVIPKKRKRWA